MPDSDFGAEPTGLLRRKFDDPFVTATGAARAHVDFTSLQTLWFNTGTLCNIECAACYIESSPANDSLVYLTKHDVTAYLDALGDIGADRCEIGFTGGEPFMNPEILDLLEASLARGHRVLILTNAMQPMMRRQLCDGLKELNNTYTNRICIRVSLDHYTEKLHDLERGAGSFSRTLEGVKWLREEAFPIAIAGRLKWGESDAQARLGYKKLFEDLALGLDPRDAQDLVLFPEMDGARDVPEISQACWNILGAKPESMMCASSRMVVKRKGAAAPVITPCTLLPYEAEFELGQDLSKALGRVQMNHPHCAKFCALGGASCS